VIINYCGNADLTGLDAVNLPALPPGVSKCFSIVVLSEYGVYVGQFSLRSCFSQAYLSSQ
jgi:hypothetical protein